MNLQTFEFPVIKSKAEIVFSTQPTNKELLEEAKVRKFYNGRTKWNEFFSKLFFGHVDTYRYRTDIDQEFLKRASTYLMAFMRSWEPKHEEKEAISAMILSEIVDYDTVKYKP